MNENLMTLLESERERLEGELAKVKEAIKLFRGKGAAPLMRGAGPVTRRKRTKGGMTTADAIITALQSDGEMDIATITEKVEGLKGGKVSTASINGTLMKLVKAKAIKKVGRGIYKKA
jgi:hypothetical protein